MFVARFLLGVVLVAVGGTFLVRRQALAHREASRGRATMGPAGWTVLGAILALAGVAQLALAVV